MELDSLWCARDHSRARCTGGPPFPTHHSTNVTGTEEQQGLGTGDHQGCFEEDRCGGSVAQDPGQDRQQQQQDDNEEAEEAEEDRGAPHPDHIFIYCCIIIYLFPYFCIFTEGRANEMPNIHYQIHYAFLKFRSSF
jgi:hypothetical protein